VRELHHWQVARHFQAEPVAGLAFGLGLRLGRLQHILRNAGHFVVGGVVGKGVGGVEGVLAEFLAELGLALLNLREPLLGRAGQLSARQDKVAHGILVRLTLLVVERGRVNGLVFGVQALVGAQPGPELGHAGEGGVVGGAQLGRVGHAVEVADRAPGPAELFGRHIQHAGNAAPACRKVVGGDLRQCAFSLCQQIVHRRADMLGQDAVEQREVGKVKEWIVHRV